MKTVIDAVEYCLNCESELRPLVIAQQLLTVVHSLSVADGFLSL